MTSGRSSKSTGRTFCTSYRRTRNTELAAALGPSEGVLLGRVALSAAMAMSAAIARGEYLVAL